MSVKVSESIELNITKVLCEAGYIPAFNTGLSAEYLKGSLCQIEGIGILKPRPDLVRAVLWFKKITKQRALFLGVIWQDRIEVFGYDYIDELKALVGKLPFRANILVTRERVNYESYLADWAD